MTVIYHSTIKTSIGLFLLLTGCVTLYKPNTVFSPLLKARGEANTSALLGLSGNGLYNLEAAYAVTDHAAVVLDGMHHSRQSGGDNAAVERFNLFSMEAGAGYFTLLGTNGNILFQCYGGAGYGASSDKIENYDQVNPEVNAKYSNVFIQPGIALIRDKFEVAFDLRANHVHMYNIHAFMYDEFDWWNTDFKYYSDTTLNFLILEPAVTMRVGGKSLKGVFQLGVVVPLVNSESYFNVNSSSRFGISLIKSSVGVSYTIKRKKLR